MPSAKRKNLKLRKSLKEVPCVVCGSRPSDPCHIKTFKVTQSDHPKNLISMCRIHHSLQHRLGWARFLEIHIPVYDLLIKMGWEFEPKVGGGIHLFHSEVK